MSAAVAPPANEAEVRSSGATVEPRHLWAGLKKLGFWLAVVLVVAAAGAVLWFLYQKTQVASLATRLIAEQELRQLQQLDSDWDVDILNSKVGLNDSYDPIVAPFQKIKAALARLEKADGANHPDVQPQIGRMREVFTQKADAVDGFKSHNSVLRNSLRYLPTAADEAKLAIASSKMEAEAPTAAELNALLDSALGETLKYAVVTDDEQRSLLMAAAQHLEEAADRISDASPAKEPLAVFSNHVRTIVKQKADEKRLLLNIVNAPAVVGAIDKSTAAFDAYFAQRSRESDFWRTALVGFSAFLLLTIAFIGWRLRQSNVEISRVNAALVASNDGLELRVQDRTRELTDTLKSLRESEVQLIQSEKMASLGQMVAGVAHEINTPLAYVRSSLETVNDQLAEVETLVEHSSSMLSAMSAAEPDPEKLASSFASLLALTSSFTEHGIVAELRTLSNDGLYGLDQIREIVVNLRNFSRLDRSKATLFDLRKGLDSTLVIAQSAVRAHQVIKRYADIPDILCAPSQLNQVFLNLITNAAYALPARGGVITVSTEVEDDMVKVIIEDNGSGIAPEHMEKIFDPFFTTKEIGKGTGLGLSIAYKIIEEHAGRIGVQSILGQGTKFSIYLPKTAVKAGSTRVEARQ